MNAKKFVNLTKFLLAGALVLGMTACSSDDDITKGGNEENKVNTYLTVSLTGNSLQRTANSSTGENGTGAENTISSLNIYLVNTSTSKVTTIHSVNPSTDFTTTSTETDKTTNAFQVPTGTYKIYVVANPSSKFSVSDGTDGHSATSESDLKNNFVGTGLGTDDYAKSTGFMMTNAVNFDGDETEIPTVSVTAANTETNPAKPNSPIHLDRMAVKIKISGNSSFTTSANGLPKIIHYTDGTTSSKTLLNMTIALTGYDLINVYKKANLYQKWSSNTSTFIQELNTPNYSSTYSYDTLEYDNQKSDYALKRINTQNTITGFGKLSVKTHSYTDITTSSYTLENNPYQTQPIDGIYTKNDNNVTGVLFKATASYNDGTTAKTTFYSYNGKYYETLADIAVEYPNAFTTYFDGSTLQTNGTVLAASSMTPEQLRVEYGIKVYENGNMYYAYYIKDPNYMENQNGTNKNYYAVMRNSIYDLRINNLKRIGEDIPFGWESDKQIDPIDAANAWMSIELVVNPWILNEITSIDL